MASEIRVNKINNRAGLGTITIADTGVVVNGIVTCTEISGLNALNIAGVSTFASPLDINGDIDVDGHTNLDNVSVAGVSTFTNIVNVGNNIQLNSSSGAITVGSGVTIESNGQATFTGIVTFGSNSTTIGDNIINVGTALTLGHTQGLQFHTQNLHSAGFEINQINASGIITASEFRGSGANLSNLPAGLGTALSQDQSSPLNKFYYTNTTLGVDSTITVDHPASASAAYTQYGEIKVNDSADLIVAEGDDIIPDVLGLAEFGTIGGGPSAGRMRVNTITNASANGAPTVSNGLIISGVTTTSDIKVGTGATLNVYGGAIYSGIITATTFVGNLTGNPTGSGANLTNIPAGQLTGSLPAIDGSNLTGVEGGKFNGTAAGILTTSTVGIQTANVTAPDLVGAATSMVGLYIGDGHLLFSNYLNKAGGYYITTGLNALNAGPVTLGTPMTLDGTWTIV